MTPEDYLRKAERALASAPRWVVEQATGFVDATQRGQRDD